MSSLKDRRRLRLLVAQILLSNTPRVHNKKSRMMTAKRIFAMHSDDIAVTQSLSPSGFIREGLKEVTIML